MPRFFIKEEEIKEGIIEISGGDAHHIKRVLRMKEGERLTVCDFFNTEYSCEIADLSGETVKLRILSSAPGVSEPPFPITLYMALPKSDKMEWIIQKAVELGVSEICPFTSAFTVVKLDDNGKEKKRERWQKIARSAAEQCGRGRIPTVALPVSYGQALERCCAQNGMAFLCYEGEERQTLKDLLEQPAFPEGISFFVGAEGGFSPQEAETAVGKGLKTVSLGRRILRCETAPLFVLSAIGYRYEL